MTAAAAPDTVRDVVIVGGGSAGWMTAAALARLTKAGVKVTLVESDAIGTIGVGEATIPPLIDFNRALGIDEAEFVAETGGTFKLGIEFVNWGRLGDSYIHPFGKYGRQVMGVSFHQFWLREHLSGSNCATRIDDFAISVAAAKRGRFTHPVGNPDAVLSALAYAYHFDAGLYAGFLRRRAEAQGLVRIEGRIEQVEQRGDDGHIAAVHLEGGRRIAGDFFVDCSGFRSLLLGQTLGVPLQSWQHWLPCDRAVAVPSDDGGDPLPYTRSTAEEAGWRWRIPLQHRVGNGHVFSTAFTTPEQATERLLAGLEGKPIADPRFVQFTPGRRERLWDRNCVAIGLSGGFIEPLESTSIHLIQSGIFRLMAMFPRQQMQQVEIDEYNRWLTGEYDHIRDFIILHYHATQRDDSEMWRYCRDMTIPDTLTERIELWKEAGRVFRRHNALFSEESWIAVLLGQNVCPRSYDPLTEILSAEENTAMIQRMSEIIGQTAMAMPRHADFIARYCPARF